MSFQVDEALVLLTGGVPRVTDVSGGEAEGAGEAQEALWQELMTAWMTAHVIGVEHSIGPIAVPCHVMLCHSMPCRAMPCHAMPC